MHLTILQIIVLVLLVVGYGLMFTAAGRTLFDVVVLLALVLLVAGVLRG